MIPAPIWDTARFDQESKKAIALFQKARLEEPVEDYSTALDQFQGVVENVLESTVDLSELGHQVMSELLCDKDQLHAFRYFSGPPISADDLKILVNARSMKPKTLRSDYALVDRITATVVHCLDRRRFPWVSENRQPNEAERDAAVLVSASMMAYQHHLTNRRNLGKTIQEASVRQVLESLGFRHVKRRKVRTHADAPANGEYCLESLLGTKKADFIVRNWDGTILGIECKVSNSAVNSFKRLNHEAGSKAAAWKKDFGDLGIIPIAILGGVYSVPNLVEAQGRGLSLFWAHAMKDFSDWVNAVRDSV